MDKNVTKSHEVNSDLRRKVLKAATQGRLHTIPERLLTWDNLSWKAEDGRTAMHMLASPFRSHLAAGKMRGDPSIGIITFLKFLNSDNLEIQRFMRDLITEKGAVLTSYTIRSEGKPAKSGGRNMVQLDALFSAKGEHLIPMHLINKDTAMSQDALGNNLLHYLSGIPIDLFARMERCSLGHLQVVALHGRDFKMLDAKAAADCELISNAPAEIFSKESLMMPNEKGITPMHMFVLGGCFDALLSRISPELMLQCLTCVSSPNNKNPRTTPMHAICLLRKSKNDISWSSPDEKVKPKPNERCANVASVCESVKAKLLSSDFTDEQANAAVEALLRPSVENNTMHYWDKETNMIKPVEGDMGESPMHLAMKNCNWPPHWAVTRRTMLGRHSPSHAVNWEEPTLQQITAARHSYTPLHAIDWTKLTDSVDEMEAKTFLADLAEKDFFAELVAVKNMDPLHGVNGFMPMHTASGRLDLYPRSAFTQESVLGYNDLGWNLLHMAAMSGELGKIPSEFITSENMNTANKHGVTVFSAGASSGFIGFPKELLNVENLCRKTHSEVPAPIEIWAEAAERDLRKRIPRLRQGKDCQHKAMIFEHLLTLDYPHALLKAMEQKFPSTYALRIEMLEARKLNESILGSAADGMDAVDLGI